MMYICQVYLDNTMGMVLVGIFSTAAKAMEAGYNFINDQMDNVQLIDWEYDSAHGTYTDWYHGNGSSVATRIITGVQLDVSLA